ncbi:MAG: YfiR family protein [Ferruginibacter sp.]
MKINIYHIARSKTRSQVKAGIVIMLLLCTTISLRAQSTPEYQLKAVFIYNFTRFVDWPPTAFESYNDDFVIGIIGNDPFGQALEATVEGETIGRHAIRIKRFQDVKQIDHCHILFINSNDPPEIKNIISDLNNRNILTVSDAANFARMGGIIGFFTDKNKIRMQINGDAAKNARLSISSKLLSVAQVL